MPNNYVDKRAGKGKRISELQEVAPEEGNGTRPHRIMPGVREQGQFFGAGQLEKPMTRGDYLKVHAMHEYHRRESRWYRKLWRLVRGLPQMADINAYAAVAHERQLQAIADFLKEKGEAS